MESVRFVKLEMTEIRTPFRFSFSHNLAVRREAHSLILALETDSGATGFGEALPRSYLTGESVESAKADIAFRWWPLLARLEIPARSDAAALLDSLLPVFREADALRRNASYAALDVAAVDAYARARGIPGRTLWGGEGERTPLVGVVSAGSPGMARRTAWALRLLGYRSFKVKVSSDAEADRRRLAAVRSAIGPGSWLSVDANAAWTPEEAVGRIRDMAPFRPDLVEQPVAAGGRGMLGRIERECGVPVMADESLCTVADAEEMAAAGPPGFWNVRLGKNGGFAGVREMARLAAAAGVRLYAGVLVGETSALAAAGRGMLGLAGFERMEYGFPRVLLGNDPFRGGPGGFSRHGARLSKRAGLGVRPRRGFPPGLIVSRETFSA